MSEDKKIFQRSTYTVSHRMVAGASFQTVIPVSFKPDAVIIRQVSYGDCTNDVKQSLVYTDLVLNSDGYIAHVYPNTNAATGPPVLVNTPLAMTYTSNQQYPVAPGKTQTGQATFSMVLPDTRGTNTNADGMLIITLEFIQFDKK